MYNIKDQLISNSIDYSVQNTSNLIKLRIKNELQHEKSIYF